MFSVTMSQLSGERFARQVCSVFLSVCPSVSVLVSFSVSVCLSISLSSSHSFSHSLTYSSTLSLRPSSPSLLPSLSSLPSLTFTSNMCLYICLPLTHSLSHSHTHPLSPSLVAPPSVLPSPAFLFPLPPAAFPGRFPLFPRRRGSQNGCAFGRAIAQWEQDCAVSSPRLEISVDTGTTAADRGQHLQSVDEGLGGSTRRDGPSSHLGRGSTLRVSA